MFREFIQYILGPFGREVLQFYKDYNLIINAVVIAYGLVLFYSHYVLWDMIRRIEAMILEISATYGSELPLNSIYQELVDQWNHQYQGKTFYLPKKNDFWFEKYMGGDVLDLLQINQDYVRMALHKLTGNPPMRDFKAIDFEMWQHYRLQLKKGLRVKTPQEIIKMRKKANV